MGVEPLDRRTVRRRPSEVRRLLLEAAERVTAREGRAISLGAIAQEAGVSRSVLYRHFANREDLLTSAALTPFVDFLTAFRSVATAQIEQRHSIWEMERSFVSAILEHFAQHRDFVSTVLSDRSVLDERTRAALFASIDAVIEEITAVGIAEGVVLGVPAENVGTWTRLVIALVTGIATNGNWLLPRGADAWSTEQLIDNLTTFILYGIQREPGQGGRLDGDSAGRVH
ncbi:MAG TPA: TetR/AcrR family transcriptional regulator [Pseudonocardia sp.]